MARVLVVDDEVQVCGLVTEILESAGHQVQEANDGVRALAVNQIDPVDVVIIDILMPQKDGLETIIQLNRTCPGTKIIAMSGATWMNELDILPIAKKLGAHRTLLKPFDAETLLRLVTEVIRETKGPS